MARPRKHADAAARQRAYRERLAESGRAEERPPDSTAAERQARHRARKETEAAGWWRDSVRLHQPDAATVEAVLSRFVGRAGDRAAAVAQVETMLERIRGRNRAHEEDDAG